MLKFASRSFSSFKKIGVIGPGQLGLGISVLASKVAEQEVIIVGRTAEKMEKVKQIIEKQILAEA